MSEPWLPTLVILLLAINLPPWRHDRNWLSVMVGLGFIALLLRYLFWRFTVTVLPATDLSIDSVVVWAVFAVELLGWAETIVLLSVILRRTDRSGEADAFEARFAKLPADRFPTVDVFIATYNEPLEVLEKSIAGAMGLDWPADKLNICVLDDGRRDWLRDYCDARGVRHMTRDDNTHAKAGNINAALAKTHGDFILVLDADFVTNRRMLVRAIGFFEDPGVGIVQMPHYFFNSDPVQTSLDIQGDLPDEQRFFFDVIQPGRDGWNCAFCCGSNGILRRSAVETIGGRMPTDSITEDMLLSLALMRKGFVTRYLNERLAIGLAPENLQAYFVQRARWAQGALQILFLKSGPFGPGLSPMQRLLFVPSHWISQSICHPVALMIPAFFLLTGIPPLIDASWSEILSYQVPVILGSFVLMRHLAPEKFTAISITAHSILQAFRILPVVVRSLLGRGSGGFKVTPKGADARVGSTDGFIVAASSTIIVLTGLGLMINSGLNTRIVAEMELLPVVTFWAVVNMAMLLLVIAMVIPRPAHRAEERFAIASPCAVVVPGRRFTAETTDMSVSGAQMHLEADTQRELPQKGDWVGVDLPGVGVIPARIKRQRDVSGTAQAVIDYGVAFHLPSGPQRDRLIQEVFTMGAHPSVQAQHSPVPLAFQMLARIFKRDTSQVQPAPPPAPAAPNDAPPAWLREAMQRIPKGWPDDPRDLRGASRVA